MMKVRHLTEVGRLLKKIREEQGISCQTVAERCGLTKQGVWSLEQGDMPMFETVRRVAKALGVTLNRLDKELEPIKVVKVRPRHVGRPMKAN